MGDVIYTMPAIIEYRRKAKARMAWHAARAEQYEAIKALAFATAEEERLRIAAHRDFANEGLAVLESDLFEVEADWVWNGRHYELTALDWLANFDRNAAELPFGAAGEREERAA